MSSIYMYHAVGSEEQIVGSDPYYAVTELAFSQHLDIIAESEPLAKQVAVKGEISKHCITFDDGHLSNYTVAFPLLKSKNLLAEFYVNTAFVGTENYMTWSQLKEMAEAGMSIQSHAHNHHYVSDLSKEQITYELATSKKLIEENLGTEVTVFAPPGGRINSRVIRIAKELGYKCIATSVPGVVNNSTSFTLPRFAVLATTSNQKISAWLEPYSGATLKERFRYISFKIVKTILGNQNYTKLRAFLLGEKTVS